MNNPVKHDYGLEHCFSDRLLDQMYSQDFTIIAKLTETKTHWKGTNQVTPSQSPHGFNTTRYCQFLASNDSSHTSCSAITRRNSANLRAFRVAKQVLRHPKIMTLDRIGEPSPSGMMKVSFATATQAATDKRAVALFPKPAKALRPKAAGGRDQSTRTCRAPTTGLPD